MQMVKRELRPKIQWKDENLITQLKTMKNNFDLILKTENLRVVPLKPECLL